MVFNLRKRVCKLYDTFVKFDNPKEIQQQDLTNMKARIAAFNAGANRTQNNNGTSQEESS